MLKTEKVELIEVAENTKRTKTSYTKRNHRHKRNSLSLLRAYRKQAELSLIQTKLRTFQSNLDDLKSSSSCLFLSLASLFYTKTSEGRLVASLWLIGQPGNGLTNSIPGSHRFSTEILFKPLESILC